MKKIKFLPQKHNTQIKKTETLYTKFVKSVPEEQINDQIIGVCEFYNLYIQAERERIVPKEVPDELALKRVTTAISRSLCL